MSQSQSYVTKSSLIALLANADKRQHVIGRALVVLYDRQTQTEKGAKTTNTNNNRGFTQADAFWGSVSAINYKKYGTLTVPTVLKWMKPDKNGTPRIAKYWAQLNEAAAERAAQKAVSELTPSEKVLAEPVAADTNPTDVIPSPRSVTVTYDLNDLRDALRYAAGK